MAVLSGFRNPFRNLSENLRDKQLTGMDAAFPLQGNNGDSQQPIPQQRRRLNLKPRDDKRAAELQRKSSLLTATSSLFGDSKPREAIIADRDGKTEEEVVREEVRKERLQLRLPPEQNQERLSSQAAVAEIEEQMKQETDERKRIILKAELVARQQKLDKLLERFAKEGLSEGEKLTGQRERYKPTRNSIDGARVNVGMADSMIPGVGGGFHRPPKHLMYPNQYVAGGGPNIGYGNGNGNGRGRHAHNLINIDNTNGGQMEQMGPMGPMGYGGRGPPPYFHAVPPGGQPYMESPMSSGNATSHMNHGNHMNVMPPGMGPVSYYGGAPEGYPGRHGGVPAVAMPPNPLPHPHGIGGLRSAQIPGMVPGVGQQVGPYQGQQSGVGIGGEIEMDFSNL